MTPAKKKAVKPKTTKPVAEKRGRGRPESYRPEYADLAYKFCLLGASDARLAEMFEVCIATIHNWKLQYPDFLDALRKGKEIADAEVAHALYHRALGYKAPEDDIRVVGGEIVITPTLKHYPPDTSAATLWLKNRQGDKWRDKIEQEVTGPNGGPVQAQIRVTFD